ncbi:glutaredoxin family protein [Gracilibacillus thailandensis]|nr:glutaredoxin domain-containing protein [Gracilibacillus thailandensis]
MKQVILYSSDHCIFCVKMKEWLKQNQISYIDKNLKKREYSQELKQYNAVGIPFILIIDNKTNDKKIVQGFQPDLVKKYLND